MKLSFFIKSIFILIAVILLKPPLNNLYELSIFFLALLIIFFFKLKKNIKIFNYKFIFIYFIIFVINNIYLKNDIKEFHSTFLSFKDIEKISTFLPSKIIKDIKISYLNFDIERALKSHDGDQFQNKEKLMNYNFIDNPFSFSADNFFLNEKLTRYVDNINFKSREKLRINQINSLKYNLAFDKDFRRELPYYVLYDIPVNYKNSFVCGTGNIYYAFSPIKNNNYNKIDFTKKSNDKCISFNTGKKLIILGYSINKEDNLKIKLHKNYFNKFLFFLNTISVIIFYIIFIKQFFIVKKISNIEVSIFLISILSTILIIILKDHNLLTGLRYYRGSADGLMHEFQANMIVKNLMNRNFLEALMGGETVFYYMPGLRYFLAIGKIIFGDTNYLYVLSLPILPMSLFYLFKNITSEKISFYLIILFTIIPIFENMGYGHLNYVHQVMRNHAETLSITIIILIISKISNPNFKYNISHSKLFLYCFFLSFASFCRPNFVPTTSILFMYLLIVSYNINFKYILSALIGYSFIFISLIHNLYFGDDYSFFTRSNIHFIFNDAFQNLFIDKEQEGNLFLNQLLKWNPIYNIHRIFILIFIIYSFFTRKKNALLVLLFFSSIAQHAVLLLTHADSRYSYLAWLLTFIIFIYYLINYEFKKNYKFWQRKID